MGLVGLAATGQWQASSAIPSCLLQLVVFGEGQPSEHPAQPLQLLIYWRRHCVTELQGLQKAKGGGPEAKRGGGGGGRAVATAAAGRRQQPAPTSRQAAEIHRCK